MGGLGMRELVIILLVVLVVFGAKKLRTVARDLFEGRFSEILIIFVLALIVLGPEKLPRVVSELGRWVGRARAMARQFREQLEEEVQLEEARKTQRAASAGPVEPGPAAPPHAPANGGGNELTPEPEVSYAHHPQPGEHAQAPDHIQTAGAPGAEPTAGPPAQAGSADEPRT
jgi:sec-independent protein translocase protein TatB